MSYKSKFPEKIQAFTLIEISIVLVIIAFLAGAVMGGMSLKHSLALKNMMDDVSKVTEAFGQFKTKYNATPGDFWNATTAFGSANTSNGNGNGSIDNMQESILFAQHLALAGLIKGNYQDSNSGNFSPANLMSGPFPNMKYYFWGNPWSINGNTTYIGINTMIDTNNDGIYNPGPEMFGSALSPRDTYKLDRKFDDGSPATGLILSGDGSETGHVANSCINGTTYVLTNANLACIVYILLDAYF